MASSKTRVIVKVESFWLSGTFDLSQTKALTFAKNIKKTHEHFLCRKNPATGIYFGHELSEKNRILHVTFETIIKQTTYGKRRKHSVS
jgi:hypothetical protein